MWVETFLPLPPPRHGNLFQSNSNLRRLLPTSPKLTEDYCTYTFTSHRKILCFTISSFFLLTGKRKCRPFEMCVVFFMHVTVFFICLSPKNAFYFRSFSKCISVFSRLFISCALLTPRPSSTFFFVFILYFFCLGYRFASLLFSFWDVPFISRLLSNFTLFFPPTTLRHLPSRLWAKLRTNQSRNHLLLSFFFFFQAFLRLWDEHFDVSEIRYWLGSELLSIPLLFVRFPFILSTYLAFNMLAGWLCTSYVLSLEGWVIVEVRIPHLGTWTAKRNCIVVGTW